MVFHVGFGDFGYEELSEVDWIVQWLSSSSLPTIAAAASGTAPYPNH